MVAREMCPHEMGEESELLFMRCRDGDCEFFVNLVFATEKFEVGNEVVAQRVIVTFWGCRCFEGDLCIIFLLRHFERDFQDDNRRRMHSLRACRYRPHAI